MGEDKARIRSGRHADGAPLAQRAADILRDATSPVLEVGPGFTDLPSVTETPAGAGPLVALAAGAAELLRLGETGAAVVLATDLPLLRAEVVNWLAAYPEPVTVVPVVGGFAQPLCARYVRHDLDAAMALAGSGARSMRDLLAAVDHVLAGPDELRAAGVDPSWIADIDTPADLARYRERQH